MNMSEVTSNTIEYGIPTSDSHHSVKCVAEGSKFSYIFFKDKKRCGDFLFSEYNPSSLTNRSKIGKILYGYSNKEDEDFQELKENLETLLIIYQELEEEEQNERVNKNIRKQRKDIKEALQEFQSHDNPLVWIASMIDWVTAGERANIMIVWLSLISQVVLHQPISIIGIGVASSGKTHIAETSLSLIPEQFVLKEKKPTLSAMFRRSEEDPWYYDGKIVYYGDMGGQNDLTESEDTKALLKELQTDGELIRPVSKKSDGGDFDVFDLELHGKPALFYTTTPDAGSKRGQRDEGLGVDGQELSRSIQYRPRIDNKEVFNAMTNRLELGGRTAHKQKDIKDKLFSIIPNVVLGLREKISGVKIEDEDKLEKTLDFEPKIKIINPFHRVIIDFLSDSEFYKRDTPKYEAILKSITAVNIYNHEIFTIDGEQIVFVTFDDIQYFFSLMEQYRAGINLNLTPSESDILTDIYRQYKIYENKGIKGFLKSTMYEMDEDDEDAFSEFSENNNDVLEGQSTFNELSVTVPDFVAWMKGKYNQSTTYRAFSTFVDKGLCTVVGRDYKKSKMYKFTGTTEYKALDLNETLKFNKNDLKLFEEEYPQEVVDFLRKDKKHNDVSIFNQDEKIDEPVWNESKLMK